MLRLATATFVALVPIASYAQSAPQTAARGITRDEFVQRAAEMAGRRFDEIDTTHAGVITRDQLRAWRQAHAAQPGAQPTTTQ